MKYTPDEKQIEELLENLSLDISKRLDGRLSTAPWMPRAVARRRFINVTASVVLILALFIAATPQGRAFAQSVLRFFIRANGDTIPVPTQPITWVEVTPGVPHPTMTPQPTLTPLAAFAKDCGDYRDAACSVEQIRDKVDFTVKEPANIPDGMYFLGATGGTDSVFLKYEFENNSGGLYVTVERWPGVPSKTWLEVGASAVVEEVKIGNLAGEYFRGSFVQNASAGDEVATWDSNETIETLRWVEDGISYTLQYSFTTQMPLGKDGLVAIAESMTTEPVAKRPMPATSIPTVTTTAAPNLAALKIALVERQAGFKLMLPPRLPLTLNLTSMSHIDARYNLVAPGVASVWFTYDDVYMNGMYLNQQVVSNLDDCAICDAVVGDDNSYLQVHSPKIVGANANLQTVQIGDVAGKYYEGIRLGSGEWDPAPDIKHLRWQVNGRAFELISLSTGLKLEELIAIAESLK